MTNAPTVTSVSLRELETNFKKAKQEREVLLAKVIEKKKQVEQLASKLTAKKQSLLDSFKQEIELLESEINETNGNILELESKLSKKQNGLLSKIFTSQQAISNLQTQLEEQNNILNTQKLKLDESNQSLNFEHTIVKDFSNSAFLVKFISQKEAFEALQKELNEAKKLLAELTFQYENSKANIDINIDLEIADQYAKVSEAFNLLMKSIKIWDITDEVRNSEIKSSAKTTVMRKEVSFKVKDIDFINSKEPALYFENANGRSLFIYPAFMFLVDETGDFNLIDLKELNFQFMPQSFFENKASIPSDTKIINYVWAKVNKDGSPDIRFKDNYQKPVVQYGGLNFKVGTTLNETYNISNFEAAQNFAKEFSTYHALLRGEKYIQSAPVITETYFATLRQFLEKIIKFIQKLKDNKSLCKLVDNVTGIESLTKEGAEKAIELLFLIDILKCFNLISDLHDMKSKEAFAAICVLGKLYGWNMEYLNIELLYSPNFLTAYKTIYDSLKGELLNADPQDEKFFRLSYILNAYDKELNEEYLSNLYQFTSIVIKADGVVTAKEEEVLKCIMKTPKEKPRKEEQEVKVKTPIQQQSLEEVLEEVNDLTGLNAVKEEIKSLINFIKIQKAREASGLKSSSISYHIVFTGNPGTGKTTVARIVSKIYKSLGILSEGQVVETDRSGLVAEYVGQTAVKVNKTVNSALNGVLFIDEAYSIVGENQDDFGKEAVATLIKRMEDDRDKLVVVLAGYTNEMKNFIDTNPGFKSRFNRYIEFVDYSRHELLSIYKTQCAKLDYKLTEDAKEKVFTLFENAFATRDKSFGNGRFVRNMFEKTLEMQANRLASVTLLDKETLTTIVANDV